MKITIEINEVEPGKLACSMDCLDACTEIEAACAKTVAEFVVHGFAEDRRRRGISKPMAPLTVETSANNRG